MKQFFVLLIVLILNITPSFADEIGICGDNLMWKYEEATGTLTISGSGEMYQKNYNEYPWYKYCNTTKTINIQEGVTAIKMYAFEVFEALERISIPSSMKEIGYLAFGCNESLKTVNITDLNSWCNIKFGSGRYPNDFTANPLNNGADLYIQDQLVTEVVIPETNKSYLYCTFSGCTSITSAKILGTADGCSLGDTFYNCPNLTSVNILANTVERLEGTFAYCPKLESVTLSESITRLSATYYHGTFTCCESLKSIEIPNSITTIGDKTFDCCSNLTSVSIPNSVTTIGKYAFSGCKNLISINIPNSITSMGEKAFSGCYLTADKVKNDSKYNLSNYGAVISDYKTSDGLYIKDNTVIACRPTGTSVTIPNGVTTIKADVFYSCHEIVSIIIPNSVTTIENNAFASCTGLTSITIPNSVTSISSNAFSGCSNLVSVNLPSYIKSIKLGTFHGCSKLKSIIIPDSVTAIGQEAFSGCKNLTSVTIPKAVTMISPKAFSGCFFMGNDIKNESGIELTEYGATMLNSRTAKGLGIKDNMVVNCWTTATSIVIPNSVTSIATNAFYRCTDLTSVEIPNSIINIGDYAFQYCTNLTQVNLPNSIMRIGNYAFSDCEGLKHITIPSSVQMFENYAFEGCTNLTTVVFEDGIKNIPENTFRNCTSLDTIICMANEPPTIYSQTFPETIYTTAKLMVPEGSSTNYSSNNNWKNFANIIDGGAGSDLKHCAKPQIAYESGNLKFSCTTENAKYYYTITSLDSKNTTESSTGIVNMMQCFEITVYAKAPGHLQSETTSAKFYFAKGSIDKPVLIMDTNDDGKVNSTDVVSVYNYIITGE